MARFVDYALACETHGCPMMEAGGDIVCLFDFLGDHLGGLAVTDLVPDGGADQPGALVFSDGHSLPLLCPHCARAARLEDPSALLAQVAGQHLVGLEYAEEAGERQLFLLFAVDPEASLDDRDMDLLEITTHPESARRLACPAERRARFRATGPRR
jgi:hypothetical protein